MRMCIFMATPTRFMAQAVRDHFRILTINVDYPDFPSLPEQQRAAVSLQQRYPGRVAFAAAFSVQSISRRRTGPQGALRQIDAAVQAGAVGVKIWKNIGMSLQDPDGRYVMPDDPRFEPIIAGSRARSHRAARPPGGAAQLLAAVRSDDGALGSGLLSRASAVLHVPASGDALARCDSRRSRPDAERASGAALRCRASGLARMGRRQGGGVSRSLSQANVDLAARLVHLEYQAARDPHKVRAIPDSLPGSDSLRQR